MELRRAVPTDAHAIGDVFMAARADALPRLKPIHTESETRAYLAGLLINPAYAVWVAAMRDMLAGFIALRGEWVDHLYVHPDWRRRGIGTRLLDIAKRDNPEGIRLFCFQCNGGARAFYAARDMVVARSTDGSGSEEQEPDLEYLWTKNQTAS